MKRKTIVLLVGLLLPFFCFSGSGTIQASTKDLPEGPYRSSCVRCHMSLGVLDCDCPKMNNQVAHSEVQVTENCQNIWNQDGKLTCS